MTLGHRAVQIGIDPGKLVSACDEYSFGVGQVGDVNTWNLECVAGQPHGQ